MAKHKIGKWGNVSVRKVSASAGVARSVGWLVVVLQTGSSLFGSLSGHMREANNRCFSLTSVFLSRSSSPPSIPPKIKKKGGGGMVSRSSNEMLCFQVQLQMHFMETWPKWSTSILYLFKVTTLCLFYFLQRLLIFRERGREGERGEEKHQCERETLICWCLLHAPNWAPGPQPRHVP